MLESAFSLPDGRRLAYAEFGDPGGSPVVWCHGNPGSRLEGDLVDPDVWQQSGVRVLVPDRPGIGRSTWQTDRAVTDWPADVVALTAAAGIDRFAVLSLSAGAPYALAVAQALPERVTRVSIVSGIGTLDVVDEAGLRDSGPRYFAGARRSPAIARSVVWLMQRGIAKPESFVTRMLAGLPDADRDVLSDPRRRHVLVGLLQEALLQGRGTSWDAALIARPWDVPLAEIAMTVDVWHGSADRNAPLSMGQWIADQVPHSRLRVIADEGHFSLVVHHFADILGHLLDRGAQDG